MRPVLRKSKRWKNKVKNGLKMRESPIKKTGLALDLEYIYSGKIILQK
jgi:hypothetical protein